MQYEVKVSLFSDTPVVGREFSPNVVVVPVQSESPNVQYNWYRLENDFCSVHPSKVATVQCPLCVNLKLPVKESYYCSSKCFSDTWKNHHARHCEAAATVSKTSNVGDQALGEFRSCGSWSSTGCWTDLENVSLHNTTASKSWRKVGSARTFVPTVDDISCFLRLESVAVDSEGNPLSQKTVIVTDRVIEAPVPIPRCMIQFGGSLHGILQFDLEAQPFVSGAFSVLSYNILSDLYATKHMYGYCPSWALTWEYRRDNLLREITGYEADILCLQEVQSDHLENFFQPELTQRGYSVIYKKRKTMVYTSNKYVIDGCATFYRRDRFREVKKYELEYSEVAQKVADALQPSEKQQEARRLVKDNVAVVVILEPMKNGASDNFDCRFCVANTHIHSNPQFTDVKLWQVATLIHGLEKIAAVQVPVLICADLNSLPLSDAHNLVVKRKVDPAPKGPEYDPIGIYQHLKLSHGLPLVSAYSSFLKVRSDSTSNEQKKMRDNTCEPEFTNFTKQFRGTIDYIFYMEDRFEVRGLLELLDREAAEKYTALPSPEWSSDHIALMANFYLKPKIRNPYQPPLPRSIF